MERNFNNREFEQYVKKNADQYRMIPSEKVWKGINNALHTRRRWYTIGLSSLLLLTAVSVTWVMLSYPGADRQNSPVTSSVSPLPAKVKKIPIAPIAVVSHQVSPVSNDITTLLSIKKFDVSEYPVSGMTENTLQANEMPEKDLLTQAQIAVSVSSPVIEHKKQNISNTIIPPAETKSETITNFSLLTNVETLFEEKMGSVSEKSQANQNVVLYPLSIESVVNSYRPIKLPKKISWQLYFAPTISYRRLSANKSAGNSGPFADPISYPFTALMDVNKAVTHKPDMGLQLGFAAKYPISRILKIKAGMQFNINKYDIKAYVYNGEQATINLNGGGNNSVTAWTNYRNYNGYKSDWLKNYYFSVSAPVGAELKIAGNKRTSVGVAGTVQPSYIIRDKAYLISTDYKNYAKVPWLVRRMNVNTSFETYISFTSRNKTQWQVGPQVRYQILSSFNSKYPVRENLFDFGMKLGVTLNK